MMESRGNRDRGRGGVALGLVFVSLGCIGLAWATGHAALQDGSLTLVKAALCGFLVLLCLLLAGTIAVCAVVYRQGGTGALTRLGAAALRFLLKRGWSEVEVEAGSGGGVAPQDVRPSGGYAARETGRALRWSDLREGHEFRCGLLSVDIAGSSGLSGPECLIAKTKGNLKEMLAPMAEARGAHTIRWEGDGGFLGIPVSDPSGDYDRIASLGIVLVGAVAAFNDDPVNGNLLETCIAVRVVGHCGDAIYSADNGKVHSSCINWMGKCEKVVGVRGAVVLTSDVWSQLVNPRLRAMFRKENTELTFGKGPPRTVTVYVWRRRKM